MPTNTHPTNRTLMAYLDGELPGDERVEIAGHVDKCAMCRRDLDTMEADLDWFLVLEAAARPIETGPQPGGLGRLLAATRQWRNAHPDGATDSAAEKRRALEQQALNALGVVLGPALAAAVQRQDAAGNAESLLAAFLGRRAAAALMTEIQHGNLDRCLASDPS
jgi:anti-sigma factor RsiW